MKWVDESHFPLLCGFVGESQNIGAKKKYLELCQNFMDVLNGEERDEL